jgi:hypothetical protein
VLRVVFTDLWRSRVLWKKKEEVAILKLCLALFACNKVAVEVKLDILAAVIYMHSFK